MMTLAWQMQAFYNVEDIYAFVKTFFLSSAADADTHCYVRMK